MYMDVWLRVELSDGNIIDLQEAGEIRKIREQIQDPEHIERFGRITIVKQSVMSDVAVGCM